ncbi:MAG: hypothetical protein H0X73_14540 [Chthoniobacterales bacterium]|nr:hypothetical protein [Chthoniobacterales bacterium]
MPRHAFSKAKLLPNPELDLESQDVVGSGEFSNARRSENTLQLGAGFAYETKKREVFLKTAEHFIDVLGGWAR